MESSREMKPGLGTDLLNANTVEVWRDAGGKFWVNVDNMCALRIGHVDHMTMQDDSSPIPDKLAEVVGIIGRLNDLPGDHEPDRSQLWHAIRQIETIVHRTAQNTPPTELAVDEHGTRQPFPPFNVEGSQSYRHSSAERRGGPADPE